MSPQILWIGWLILFLVYELAAFKAHKGGTLSETTWRWFAVKGASSASFVAPCS